MAFSRRCGTLRPWIWWATSLPHLRSLRLPSWCCWLPVPWACSSPSRKRERERERERESITRQTKGDNSDYQRQSSWISGGLPGSNRRRPSGGRRGCLERISKLHNFWSDFELTQNVFVSWSYITFFWPIFVLTTMCAFRKLERACWRREWLRLRLPSQLTENLLRLTHWKPMDTPIATHCTGNRVVAACLWCQAIWRLLSSLSVLQ